jgi:hypothetical protein
MLNRDEFESIEKGDMVETSMAIFPKLSPTAVVLKATEVEPTRKSFVVMYFGITLGKWTCSLVEGNKLKWEV